MNQDKVTLEAIHVTGDVLNCDGCFFYYGTICNRSMEFFPCLPDDREDGREVIWVIAKDQDEAKSCQE